MSFLGSLVKAGVSLARGGLAGQNEGDDENYKRQRQARDDKREEERYDNEVLLKRYAYEQAAQRDQATNEERRAQAELRGRQMRHYDFEEKPEWERKGYDSLEAYNAVEHRPPAVSEHERNIDPNSREGIAARLEYERGLSGIPGRARPPRGSTAGDDYDIKDLNSAIDDNDRELGTAERAVPKPFDPLFMDADSTAYTASRDRALAKVSEIAKRRDRFSSTRDSLVAHQHGMDRPPASVQVPAGGGRQSASAPEGTDPSRLSPGAGHGSGTPQPPIGTRTPPPAAAAAPVIAANPKLSEAMHEINRQYEEALAWRGPNGEKKNAEAVHKRYLEAMAQVQTEAGGAP